MENEKDTVEKSAEIIELTKSQLEEIKQNQYVKGQIDMERETKKQAPSLITVKEQEPKNLLGYSFRALLKSKMKSTSPLEIIKTWEANESRPEGRMLLKAMNSQTMNDGGFYLESVMSNEIIPALREKTIFRQLGAREIQLVNGQMLMRTEGSGAIAFWVGESEDLTQTSVIGTQQQFGSNAIGAFVVVSNQLLEYATPDLESDIERDLIYAVATKQDATFLRGVGGEHSPKGISALMDSTHKFNANATVSADNVVADLAKAKLLLRTANIPMEKPVIILSPRSLNYLETVKDTNGFYVFRDEILRGRINGMPFVETQIVPDNISTNKSEVYIGDIAQAVIGNDMRTMIEVVRDASYPTTAGMLSTTTRNETLVKIFEQVGFNLKYKKAFVKIEAVGWGA